MGELLGIGMPHAPNFQFRDEAMANILKRRLVNGRLNPKFKDLATWPTAMQREWGDDEGLTAAREHRRVVVDGLRKVREELDHFDPDVIIVFGDDQYENFQETVIPPYCLYMFDEMDVLPYLQSGAVGDADNVWNEPPDATIRIRGHREAAHHMVSELLAGGFDIAWAMRPNHHPTLSHAFTRTLIYLDYDRNGFPYPYVPFHVNAYGSDIARDITLPDGTQLDKAPPAPSPSRCFDLGEKLGNVLRASQWRAAIIGSSSWSHAFLTEKNEYLYPDIESDRRLVSELRAGQQSAWRHLNLSDIRQAGQHELLNWICMAGAMKDASPEVFTFAETYIFNSTKVIAVLRE